MRVAFVLPGLRASGGVGVATQHARLMRDALGVDAELVVTGAVAGGVDPRVPVRTLPEAREGHYDVAIGTWWETVAPALSLPAERHAMLVQSFEQRFYGREAPFERLSAEATLALPVDFVVVGEWMRELLADLRPGAHCRVVLPGVDKRVFAGGRSARDGPLRVLIEGQPTLPFKGVEQAMAAVGAMREPVRSTLVALEPERGAELMVDRVTGALDPDGMAALYRDQRRAPEALARRGARTRAGGGLPLRPTVRRDPLHRPRGVRSAWRERAGRGLRRPARHGGRAGSPGSRRCPARAAVGGSAGHRPRLAECRGLIARAVRRSDRDAGSRAAGRGRVAPPRDGRAGQRARTRRDSTAAVPRRPRR